MERNESSEARRSTPNEIIIYYKRIILQAHPSDVLVINFQFYSPPRTRAFLCRISKCAAPNASKTAA